MRVIPVIDLMGGEVVRGVAGRRSEYRPIVSHIASSSQPATVAKAFAVRFGFNTAYVADLDAIRFPRERKDYFVSCYREIVDQGILPWLDAGIGDVKAARYLKGELTRFEIPCQWVVGLESLSSPEALAHIAEVLNPQQTIVSLDLKDGAPLTSIAAWRHYQPLQIARELLATGITRLLVLDLADVGVGRGTGTLDLCRAIRREFPAIELIGGGGVRGIDDLRTMADAGCDAALVASALHDGRLTPEEIRQVENLPR